MPPNLNDESHQNIDKSTSVIEMDDNDQHSSNSFQGSKEETIGGSNYSSWSDFKKSRDADLNKVEPRPIEDERDDQSRFSERRSESVSDRGGQDTANLEGVMPKETSWSVRSEGRDPLSYHEPVTSESRADSGGGFLNSSGLKLFTAGLAGMMASQSYPRVKEFVSGILGAPGQEDHDAGRGVESPAPGDTLAKRLQALNGGKAIEEYSNDGVDFTNIKRKRFGVSLPSFKKSRSNDEPRSTAGWARKIFTGNLVVRRSFVESLGKENGKIEIQSNEYLDKRTTAGIAAAVLQSRSVSNRFLTEIKERQERTALIESGIPATLNDLSNNTKKLMQHFDIHEHEIKHLDIDKVAQFARAVRSTEKPIGITSKLLDANANGRPSARRGLDHDARDYYAAPQISRINAATIGATARAPKSMVKLSWEALNSPDRATTAYLKGCMDSTGFVDSKGKSSLFKESYERSPDYDKNRAIPVVGAHLVDKSMADRVSSLVGDMTGHLVDQAIHKRGPDFGEIGVMLKDHLVRAVSPPLDNRSRSAPGLSR